MTKRPAAKSVGEETLALHLRANGIEFKREVEFHQMRRWRLDFVIVDELRDDRLAVEVDGGNRKVVKGIAVGRHTQDDDYEKLAEAIILGYRVMRFTPKQIKSGYAIDAIWRALA